MPARRQTLGLGMVWTMLLALASWEHCRAEAAEAGDSGTVLLSDVDVSHEIQNVPHPRAERKLLPRRRPGYDDLHCALWSGGPNTVAALLSMGADPNALSKDGVPILHFAIWVGRHEMLEDLLRAGADPNLADKHGRTPLDIRQETKILALLHKYAALRDRKAIVPPKPPRVLRQPAAIFGSPTFSAGGGRAIVYSPDGTLLITGDEGGAIRFFDAKTGQIQDVIRGHDDSVLGLVFIPKTRILVSAGEDKTVRFWDLDTLQELKRLKDHWGQGKALAVSPDGRFVCTGAHVWQIESATPLTLAKRGHSIGASQWEVGALWCFFTPDSRYLVVCRNPGHLWVWDVAKQTIHHVKGVDPARIKSLTWKEIGGAVDIAGAKPGELLALLADQYTVLSGPADRLRSVERIVPSLPFDARRALACSPNGQYLAGFGYNSRIARYDLEHGRWHEHDGHAAAVQAVAVSPDGSLIASGSDDSTVRIWKRSTREQIMAIPTETFVYSVCFSADGDLLAIGDAGGYVYLWNRHDKSVKSYRPGGRITDLAFDPRGKFLVSVGNDIHVYDLDAHATRAKTSAESSAFGAIALSPDGRLIVGTVNSSGRVANVWSIDGAELFPNHYHLCSLEDRTFTNAIAFSPDGKLLAANSQAAIRLWDTGKKEPVGEKLCGHTYSIGDLKFSPNGKWLASASWDGTARLWEMPSGRQAALLDADVYRVCGVDFTPEGDLVTANWDGTVHLWELSTFNR